MAEGKLVVTLNEFNRLPYREGFVEFYPYYIYLYKSKRIEYLVMIVPDKSRLIRCRPVRCPLVQLRMDTAQVEKSLQLLMMMMTFLILYAASSCSSCSLFVMPFGGRQSWRRRFGEKVSGAPDSPDELQFMVDGMEGRQAIDVVQRSHVVAAGLRLRDGIGQVVMRSIVRNSFGAASFVTSSASVAVTLAVAGRHPLAIGRAEPAGRLVSISGSKVVDQVFFTDLPRSANIPRTRPVIVLTTRVLIVCFIAQRGLMRILESEEGKT